MEFIWHSSTDFILVRLEKAKFSSRDCLEANVNSFNLESNSIYSLEQHHNQLTKKTISSPSPPHQQPKYSVLQLSFWFFFDSFLTAQSGRRRRINVEFILLRTTLNPNKITERQLNSQCLQLPHN